MNDEWRVVGFKKILTDEKNSIFVSNISSVSVN
jgi:hypothetical protein